MTAEQTAAGQPAAPSQKIDVRLWLAIFGLWLAPAVTVSVSPLINAAAMGARDLNEAQVGLARSCEVLLNASLVIYLSSILPRLKPRQLGLIGVLMIAAGNALGTLGSTLPDFIGARMIAGAGAACALSAGAALIARVKSPQRVFGAVSIPITAIGVTCTLTAGYLAKTNAQLAAMGVIAAAALFGAFFVLLAPKEATPQAKADSLMKLLSLIRHPYVIAALFGFVGGTAVWAFFALRGEQIGLDRARVAEIIAYVSVATGVFAVLGAAIRDHWVPYIAVTAVTFYTIGVAGVALAPTVPLFIAAQTITSFSYVIIQNTFTTISARIDRSGSLTAAGLGWSQLANATAPFIGGALITATAAYWPLAALAILTGTICAIFITIAVRKLPPP